MQRLQAPGLEQWAVWGMLRPGSWGREQVGYGKGAGHWGRELGDGQLRNQDWGGWEKGWVVEREAITEGGVEGNTQLPSPHKRFPWLLEMGGTLTFVRGKRGGRWHIACITRKNLPGREGRELDKLFGELGSPRVLCACYKLA